MKQFQYMFLIFTLLLLSPICLSEKILFFFGAGSYSQKNSAWPWATELADRGHEVTFISGHVKQPTKDSKVRDMSLPTFERLVKMMYGSDRFTERKENKDKNILMQFSEKSVSMCETILFSEDDTALQHIIHNETYDLVVVNVIFGECGIVFSAIYNAKTILFDGTVPLPWFADLYGFHIDSTFIPDVLMKYENFPFSLVDRMKSTFWLIFWYAERHRVLYPGIDKVMQKFWKSENVPSFYELEKNADLIVVNSHFATDFAYSLPPSVIQIGGMQTFLPEKEIPPNYQKFMDDAGTGGVVLITFGSTVQIEEIPPYYMNIFFKLIRKHENVRFLMKWKGPLPRGYERGMNNLLLADWLPQRELLRHPKMKAFITHGGLNSIQEATYYGVPLLILPLFAEQDYNAYRVQAQKVGIRLEVRELSFELMDNALKTILNDPQYKKNMKVKSKVFRDRPQSPLETIIFWTEFVLRNHDLSAIKPMNGHLNWYQRRLLDVYLAYMIIFLVPVILMAFIVFKILQKLICRNVPTKVTPSKKKKQ